MTKVLARLDLVGKPRAVLLATLLACTAFSTASAAGPITEASATYTFCNGWLKPWGQAGDRCDAETKGSGQLAIVKVLTVDRAGCVTYIGWYGEYHHAWECAPAGTYKTIYVPYDGGWHRGAIRNNNKSYGASFGGWQSCYTPGGYEQMDFCY